MSNCKYETKNGRCSLKDSYAYRHKCYTEESCKCHEAIEPCGRREPMTNADRIRAMTDEELAEFIFLSAEMEFDVCLCCQFGNPTPMDDRGQCLLMPGACVAESRAEAFKKWLQQPAEGDA